MTFPDLSSNQIHGKIPTWVWSFAMENLHFLNLSCNFLVDLERPLTDLSSSWLHTLDFHSNMLQGPIPILPGATPTFLDYSHNNFSTIPVDFTSNVSRIFILSVSSNKLIGKIPPWICNASMIVVLDLYLITA